MVDVFSSCAFLSSLAAHSDPTRGPHSLPVDRRREVQRTSAVCSGAHSQRTRASGGSPGERSGAPVLRVPAALLLSGVCVPSVCVWTGRVGKCRRQERQSGRLEPCDGRLLTLGLACDAVLPSLPPETAPLGLLQRCRNTCYVSLTCIRALRKQKQGKLYKHLSTLGMIFHMLLVGFSVRRGGCSHMEEAGSGA